MSSPSIIMHNQREIQHFNIEMEYADDLNKLTSDHNNIHQYEHNMEENLGKKGLKVN